MSLKRSVAGRRETAGPAIPNSSLEWRIRRDVEICGDKNYNGLVELSGPNMSRVTHSRSRILLILLLSLTLNSVGVWFGLPSYEGWFSDEMLPPDVRRGIDHGFAHGWHYKYPPLHYYLLAVIQAPFLVAAKFQEVNFDDLILHSVLILLGRLLSVIMGVCIVFFVYKCGREILNERSSLLAALTTAFIVPLVKLSKAANPDVPYLFWFAFSLYFYLRILKTRQRRYYILFALTAVLSVCTKDKAYGLYILPVVFILFRDWTLRKKESPRLTLIRFITDPTYLYAGAVALAAFSLIHNLAFNMHGFRLHLKAITGSLVKDAQLFPHTLAGHVHMLGRAVDQIRFSLGWPLFAVCVAGLAAALVARRRNIPLLSLFLFPLSFEIFLIHVVMYNYARFYLPACVILSLFGGAFLGMAWDARHRLNKLIRVVLIGIFAYSFLYASSIDVLMLMDSRYAAEKWIRKNIPPSATLGIGVWGVYGPRFFGFRYIKMESPFTDFDRLPSRPDYIILTKEFTQRYLPDSGATEIFRRFYVQEQKYKIVYRYKTPLDWLPLSNREVQEQINVINPEVLILKKRDAHLLKASVPPNLAEFFQKEKVTIAVTDSGLGGLSVMAEAVRRMKEDRVFKGADYVFFNALFSLEGGYNSLKTRREKIDVFSSALENLEKKYRPDLILIGCNTLSVLYPDTPFSRKTKIPVIGIVGAGLEMIAESLRAKPGSSVIIFGTPTTVSEATHKKMLINQGFPEERIVLESCPELENYIERDCAGEETGMLISAAVDEALQKIGSPPPPFYASLNCTHYGYSLPLWEKAFEEAGAKPLAIVNPNSRMIDPLFKPEHRGRFKETAISARVVSMVEIGPEKRLGLGKWLKGISPEVAAALRSYGLNPSLFEWQKFVRSGT
ncbi:MAG: glycosyltransferase family 39 protein [Clostridiales bacterium]|nr:glycosyltransferase family 39 protein [Clostridiales bacterium]